jgi:hypothetical protein
VFDAVLAGRRLEVTRTIELYDGDYDPERYGTLRAFLEDAARELAQAIVVTP